MTMTLVQTVTLSGSAANIEFSAIPQSATDLVVVFSLRSAANDLSLTLRLNGDTGANYYETRLIGNGSAASSTQNFGSTSSISNSVNPSTYTASTFASGSIYIPNYVGSAGKLVSLDSVTENNATTSYQTIQGVVWASTAAVTSITLGNASNLAQYSTASLYTITKGSGGATVS